MQEGTLLRWVKHEGDSVSRGDVIAEIETDKATVELEAFASGVLRRMLVNEGQTVPVGQVIAIIAAPDEEIAETAPQQREGAAPAEPRIKPADHAPPAAEPTPPAAPTRREAIVEPAEPAGEEVVRVSPVARRLAEEHGIDLRQVRGTGPEGRIIRRDIEKLLAERATAAPAPEVAPAAPLEPLAEAAYAPPRLELEERPPAEELSRMRRTIARRMTQSKQEIPHFYVTVDVDMTAALELRRSLNQVVDEDARISVNDLVIKATAQVLRRMPRFNSYFLGDKLQPNNRINVAIAVALEDGLVTPAIVDCDRKSLGQIAREARDLAQRARNGHLRPEEYGSGTFTISNLGMYGVDTLIAIINPPQVGILGVGAVTPTPVVRDGQVVVREIMKMALSGDHRAVDGAQGAQFLAELKRLLESPMLLLL